MSLTVKDAQLTVKEAQEKLKEAQDALRKAKSQEQENKKLEQLNLRPSAYPPGFYFEYYHRHDPFEGYYRLCFRPKDGKFKEWEISDGKATTAREFAWKLYDQAVEICKTAGLFDEKE